MKGFRNFISLLVVIGISVIGIYTVCIFNASNFLNEKNITKTVKKVNLIDILSDDAQMTSDGPTASTMDKIYDMANNVSISKEHVDAVINSDAVKELVSNYINHVVTYITTGEEKNISGAELTELVRNNIDTISSQAELNLSDSMKQNVVNGVERYADDIVILIPSPKVVTDSIGDSKLAVIQNLFNNQVKINLLLSLVGLTLLLMLLQFSWWRWLPWGSVSAVVIGIVSCILGLVTPSMIEGLLTDHNEVTVLKLLNSFSDILSNNFYIIGCLLIFISFIMISIYVNVRHRFQQKEVNKAKESIQKQKEMLS